MTAGTGHGSGGGWWEPSTFGSAYSGKTPCRERGDGGVCGAARAVAAAVVRALNPGTTRCASRRVVSLPVWTL